MHVVFRESHGLEETETPFDLGQSPADLVVLSFSDSDLGAFAAGWHRAKGGLPTLRLANLVALKHPLSVDTYLDQTLAHARGILIRLIGGESYWSYGLMQVQDMARRRGIALAVLPADGREDARLDTLSTLPTSTLRRLSALCDAGGAVAAQAALAQLALAAGLYAGPVAGEKTMPDCGWYDPDRGVIPAPVPRDRTGGGPHAPAAPGTGGPLRGSGRVLAVAGAAPLPPHQGRAAASASPPPPAPAHEGEGRHADPEHRDGLTLETHPGPVNLRFPSPPWGGGGGGGGARCGAPADVGNVADTPAIAVTFYRSYLTAADTAPVDALIHALRQRGFNAYGLFTPSLKSHAAWLSDALAALNPAAIVNATAFSARGEDGASPLDAPGCPVFQVALSTARRRDWVGAERGLSPADLAMHVVLPEVDGRIFAGVASFKSPSRRDPDLEFSRFAHRADMARVNAIADRVHAWHRLAATPALERRLALILSTYPGRADQMAHAVGLDALASAEAILRDLAAQDYASTPTALAKGLGTEILSWPLDAYRAALATLPQPLQDALAAAWGAPESDPACKDGSFHFHALTADETIVALQPERGDAQARDTDYHDLARTPRHGYVAFYLWLRSRQIHALVHIGAHGTLEWLPGKAVALSDTCWPEALTGPLPVIYPFIVNDPGEAAQAKRRIGAVTLGHLPPPQIASHTPDRMLRLERLLDEYSTADGLDPARRTRLIAAIRIEAQAAGVEDDLGLTPTTSPAEAITRIDRFVCDIKESQFGDGLHIWGQGAGETAGLRAALNGRRVAPGPSGSPNRGRRDVLPTGRNLYSVDPRAVPSRAAQAQGVKLAEELLRRHLQDHGDWPRGLVVDLWGSATMRTAGEEFAMALHLAGLAPLWDQGSERVSGFEILPLALLDRPRIDVTLRVSGLFRDTFPGLAQMFEAATQALACRDEAPEDNPYTAHSPRVFGPKPGLYGMGMADALEDYTDAGRARAGEAWLAASEWALDAKGNATRDRASLEARLHGADAFAHVQDLPETDLLLASDYAAHEGGFAAAMATLGHAPAQYHIDATREGSPRARTLPEEIARVIRARAANPDWANGMMRHGFRGAAEITATMDHLAAFAHLTRAVPAHLIDLYHDATLGRPDLTDFMARENPAALAALTARFQALHDAGLWVTRRNSIAAGLAHG